MNMYLFEAYSYMINNDYVFVFLLFVIGMIFIRSGELKKKYVMYLLGSALITILLKSIFFEERVCTENIVECPESSSFPSGHALLSFSSALFFYKDKDSLLVMLLLAFMVSLSRLYLGVHDMVEIAAGFGFSLFYFSLWWKNGWI